ncbi:guanylate-binding protein 1-like [Mercenaria mercenaria]|uniref:guanylate-binding protein 1-like n=1 Tax=Mercenaria mercenaria TaxID=6596 RepID=UPI00234F695A|nr:guanylate-binding protein 1-like [Mercenaria mercenaria]
MDGQVSGRRVNQKIDTTLDISARNQMIDEERNYGSNAASDNPLRSGKFKKLFKNPFKPLDTASDSASTKKRYEKLQIFAQPMHLISTDKEGRFQIHDDALGQIKKIESPLAVVAIAGLYRTGKSYLMNRLAGSTSGFDLGNTIQSKTKGIWVWCRPHPKLKDHVLLLLDTEGLGDISKGDVGHDNKIFTLAALLCNVLVYNMMSAFNHDAVEKLTFITEMSKNIHFDRRSGMDNYDGEKLALILPTFVLCLRDFSLLLEKDGIEITADQYLEDCLAKQLGTDCNKETYNRPRECIKKYFPTRKCFTFDTPGNRDVILRLDKARPKELSKAFEDESKKFVQFVYQCKGKALLTSKTVTGIMFAGLVESYVQAIRHGAVPDVDDAILVVSKIENRRAAAAAVETFTRHLENIKQKLPILHKEEFYQLFQSIQETSLTAFRMEAMFESEPFEKEASKEMEELWMHVSRQNVELVRKYYADMLDTIYDATVGSYLKSGRYSVAGGYTTYRLEMGALKETYKSKANSMNSYEAQQAWRKFLDEKEKDGNTILTADQQLTEEDRKRELEKIQQENQRAQQEQKALFDNMMKEEKMRSEKHIEKLEIERQSYKKKEEGRMKMLTEKQNQQEELNKKQLQMMTAENKKQKMNFELEVKNLKEELLRREKENEDRIRKQLEEEQKQYKMQVGGMNQALKGVSEVEKIVSEKVDKTFKAFCKEERKRHEKEMKLMNDQVEALKADVRKEQAEKQQISAEMNAALVNAEKDKQEKELIKREKEEEKRAKEQLERERDAVKTERELFKYEKEKERRKNEQLELAVKEERDENEFLKREKENEKNLKEGLEEKMGRVYNRNIWERVVNKKV